MGCLGYHHRAAEKCEVKQQEGAAAADVTLKPSPQKEAEKVKQGRDK